MTFDPQIALNYAAAISRPRRVGSGADEDVAAEIEEKLRGWGYRVERQPFTFTTAPNVFLTLVIVANLLLVIVMMIGHGRWPVVADAAALLLVALILLFMPLNRRVQSAALLKNGRGLKWGKRHTTANLIARPSLRAHPERSVAKSKDADEAIYAIDGDRFASFDSIPPKARNSAHAVPAERRRAGRDALPHLYLIAHYDSKSQHMPLAVRITLFMLAIGAGLILVVLTLLNVSTVLYLPIGLLTLAAAFPLLFLDIGNNSPGAIDNASSVGLVLHLAEVLAQREDWQDKLHLTLLFPSAEELTLMGSVAYVVEHAERLREQDRSGALYILNFDGVGIDGELYYVGHSHQPQNSDRISLLTHVQRACVELNLPLKRFGFIGALFDHIPFAQRGFDALSLVAVGRASRSVHTPADAVDQLHVRGFDQAGQVTLRVIEQILI